MVFRIEALSAIFMSKIEFNYRRKSVYTFNVLRQLIREIANIAFFFF